MTVAEIVPEIARDLGAAKRRRARELLALEPMEGEDVLLRRQARRVRVRFVEDAAVADAERTAPAPEVESEHVALSFVRLP